MLCRDVIESSKPRISSDRLVRWLSESRPEEAKQRLGESAVIVAILERAPKGIGDIRWKKAREAFEGTCIKVLASIGGSYVIANKRPLAQRVAAAWFDHGRAEALLRAIELNELFVKSINYTGVALRVAVGAHESDALRTVDLMTPNQVAYSRDVFLSTEVHTVPSDEELAEIVRQVVLRARSGRKKYRLPSQLEFSAASLETPYTNAAL